MKKYLIYLLFPLSLGLPLTSHNIFHAVNYQRSAYGIPLVNQNSMLDKAADVKAKELARTGVFSHYVNGQIWQFVISSGYKSQSLGEVLATDFVDPVKVAQAWINSPEHKNIILANRFTDAGTSIACDNWGDCYEVMEFGSPAPLGQPQ